MSSVESLAHVARWVASIDDDRAIRLAGAHASAACLDSLALLVAGHRALTSGTGGLRTHAPIEDAPLAVRGGTPMERAAQAYHYARAANVLDGDDGHDRAGAVHLGAAVFGTLFAASRPDDTFRSLLAAAIAGYEVGIRAGAQFATTATPRSAVASGAAACVAATAALARLRALDAPTTQRALSFALANAPLSSLASAEMRESLGWAAFTALLGVAAARSDVGGTIPQAAPLRSSLLDLPLPDWIGPLGAPMLASTTYLKPYPSCRVFHTGVDAALALRQLDDFSLENITEIVVDTTAFGATLTRADPATIDEAVFSYPICLAIALHRGRLGIDEWLGERFLDPEIRATAQKVRVIDSGWAGTFGTGVYPARLTLARGTTRTTHETTTMRGTPTHPLTRQEFRHKIDSGFGTLLSAAEVDRLDSAIRDPGDRSVAEVIPFLYTGATMM